MLMIVSWKLGWNVDNFSLWCETPHVYVLYFLNMIIKLITPGVFTVILKIL